MSLLIYGCNTVEKGDHEICRFYLTTQSGGHLGMTRIFKDGTIQVSTGWQEGLYGDTLLQMLFNNRPLEDYDMEMFHQYYEKENGKLSTEELDKLENLLDDVRDEEYIIKEETEDDIYFAWIGVIVSDNKVWSFYDDDIDGKMKNLFGYLRECSQKVFESKSKTGDLTYPFLSSSSPKQSEEIIVVDEDCDDELMVEDDEQYFVRNRDGFIYLEDGFYMKILFNKDYSGAYPDYSSFKVAVLKDKVTPPLSDGMPNYVDYYDTEVGERFVLDSVVVSYFKNTTQEKFLDKYCHVDSLGRFLFNEKYSDNVRLTIAYCLWSTGLFYYYGIGFSSEAYMKKDSSLNPIHNLGLIRKKIRI